MTLLSNFAEQKGCGLAELFCSSPSFLAQLAIPLLNILMKSCMRQAPLQVCTEVASHHVQQPDMMASVPGKKLITSLCSTLPFPPWIPVLFGCEPVFLLLPCVLVCLLANFISILLRGLRTTPIDEQRWNSYLILIMLVKPASCNREDTACQYYVCNIPTISSQVLSESNG